MFIEACYKFLEHLRTVKNASDHTVRNYTIDLNTFKEFLEKEVMPDAKPEDLPAKVRYDAAYDGRFTGKDSVLALNTIDKKVIRRFLANLTDKNQNKSTIVRRLSSLRTFFKFALGQSLIEHNPTEDLESPKIDKRLPTYLTFEQVQKFIEQPDTTNFLGFRDRTILEMFYSSGLRVSELVGLNRADVDLENLTVRIRGKGKKERLIPITKNAATWIKSYLDHAERYQDLEGHEAQKDPEAIFLNKLGSRLTARSVDRNFEKYLKSSGLEGHITPHTIRHTIATHWLENGMDLKTIQLILGHRSISATTIYTRVSPNLKKKVYDETHPRA
ncbi:MAG: tyrosine recombinase XerC [Chlamydiales bacterium]|nr:tyrosine recombinase XerC [Chlamydiales bacterium]